MENPSTWGEAQHVISETLIDSKRAEQDGTLGYSLTTQIFNALVESGLLVDDREDLPEEMAWKKFRERLDTGPRSK